jgi:RecB family exonuclease
MRRELSASGLHRALACPASAVLPHVRETSPAATRGTVIHRYLEAIARGAKPEQALEAVPSEHRTVCEAIDVGALPACDPETFRSEVALAFDTATGWARELGSGISRAYAGLDPTEIPGTADVLGVGRESVYVADYKSGFRPVPPARDNLQLRFLALAACRAHDRPRAVVAIIRLREDGTAWYDQAELSVEDLADTEGQLRTLVAGIERVGEQVFAGETPAVTLGEHCSYCPAKTHCPAYTGLIRHLAQSPDEVLEEISSRLTPELASQAYARLKVAEEALELAKKALQSYARETPIPLGGDMVYGEVETTRSSIDAEVAAGVLKEAYGAKVADAAIEQSVSQASIKRALEAAKPKGKKVQAALEEVLAKLREAGGLTEKPVRMLKEHRVRETTLVPQMAAGGGR